MRIHSGIVLTLLTLILPTRIALAEGDDHEHILTLIEKAFDAVSSGNPDDWRAIQLAEGTSISFRPDPNGKAGELQMRMSTNEALLAGDGQDDRTHMERWTSDPTLLIRSPIAVVWGEYEYWIDGAFSHCGIDAIDLVKLDGQWKIVNWMWTVEEDNCPTDPSAK